MNTGPSNIADGASSSPPPERESRLASISAFGGTSDEERLAVVHEVLPHTLRWLYYVRLSLYIAAALVALAKVVLSQTVSSFLLDLITDNPVSRRILEAWVHALQSIVSGLLATTLALVIATFFIQARLLAQVRKEPTASGAGTAPRRRAPLVIRTLYKESAAAILTGCVTFAISELLSPGVTGTALGFALLAGIAAGGLNTLYFHLLFLLKEPPVHSSEKHYREILDQIDMRLADGSMRLQEALIGRFEADYRRSVIVNRAAGRSRRQMREAKRQLKERLWVIDRVVPRNQLVAFTAHVKEDPQLLERWTEEVDWLVNAAREVQRRQGPFGPLLNLVRPGNLTRLTVEERRRFANGSPA